MTVVTNWMERTSMSFSVKSDSLMPMKVLMTDENEKVLK